jgi:hypothetical protein
MRAMTATERYIDHEIKNRLMVLEQIKLCEHCPGSAVLPGLVGQLMETVVTKSALLRLASRRYTARFEDVVLSDLIAERVERYKDAEREDHWKELSLRQ